MFVYTACDFGLHWPMLISKLTQLAPVDEVYTTSIRVPNLHLYRAESLSPELLAAPLPVQPVIFQALLTARDPLLALVELSHQNHIFLQSFFAVAAGSWPPL